MRALLAVSALLLTVLAGCSTPQPPTAPPPPPPPVPALAFAPDVTLPGPGDGEPNIAMLPDGTLFVTSPAGGAEKPNAREGAAYLWRSKDHGASWDVLRGPTVGPAPPPNPVVGRPSAFCSCDADVVTGPDGWVYYVDWWIAGFVGPGNYLVESSGDGGATWTSNSAPVPQNSFAGMDREWLVAGPDGFVGLFYSFFGATPVGSVPVPAEGLDRPAGEIEAVFSSDHGASWTDPVAVVPAEEASHQIAHPRMLPDGTLWMPYGATKATKDYWNDPSEVRVAVSHDKGKTWTTTSVADVPHGFDNLWAVQGTTDPVTGTSAIVWSARQDKTTQPLYLATSANLTSWSAPIVVAANGTNVLPWASARNGTLTVGWYGSPFGGDPAKAPSDTSWYAMAAQWSAAGWSNATRVSDKAVMQGPLCPRGASCANARQLLDYVSLETAADGTVHYAYASYSGSGAVQVHVAHTT